ncbi:hypothetical protein [Pseudomonas umsongensis]|jgi:hypothetical protein|uniref:hypothetical protein n=1 Tax=Pseudomonas umsongensis TaxID=198618 RepID=UPI0015BB8084|nr:hypothetical protein [Pseudomonas umsongensis]NWL20388.1 hypothetical protein [Pseudomonas umsongensis]
MPLDAVKQLKKRDDLIQLASHERAQHGKYVNDLTAAKNQSVLLQARTGKPVSENARLKLLNYIKEYNGKYQYAYSARKLDDAKKGVFDPGVRINDRPSVQSAVEYYEELMAVQNPNFSDFWSEADRIRDRYFIRK